VVRAGNQAERHNCGVAILVDGDIFPRVCLLALRRRPEISEALHDVRFVDENAGRPGVDHVIGEKLLEDCGVATPGSIKELSQQGCDFFADEDSGVACAAMIKVVATIAAASFANVMESSPSLSSGIFAGDVCTLSRIQNDFIIVLVSLGGMAGNRPVVKLL
jgi:hypothetical protein